MPLHCTVHSVLLLVITLLNVDVAYAEKTRATEKPNVLFIMTDDQGWADVGYNNPKVYSPNIDKLANEGAKLLRYYSMPQCTPSRVALLTGIYPGRFGNQALQASNEPLIPVDIPNLATMFKSHGYATSICGKWHLGYRPDRRPHAYGFDESYGLITGACGNYDHRYREGPLAECWHRNQELIAGNEDGTHVTDLLTDEAVRYIQRDRDVPFFLYLPFTAVHTPLDERGQFIGQPTQLDPNATDRWMNEKEIRWFNDPEGKIQSEPDPEKRLFLAAVYHLDHAIGEVIKALEVSGQRTNTIIVFSSDNGPQGSWPGNAYPDDLKLTNFNQPLPMRGKKTDVWEGGIHLPGFITWPEKILPKEIADPLHLIDWLPTLAGLIGDDSSIDGLDGTDASQRILYDQSMKERDLYWIWNERTNRWALSLGDWKIVKYGANEPQSVKDWQLFNLATDPKEKLNIASDHPEIVLKLHKRFVLQRAKDKKVSLR